MISSGQVEFSHSPSIDGTKTRAASLLRFGSTNRRPGLARYAWVRWGWPVFTKLHAKVQVTCWRVSPCFPTNPC